MFPLSILIPVLGLCVVVGLCYWAFVRFPPPTRYKNIVIIVFISIIIAIVLGIIGLIPGIP
jgi:hypothetical protein